MGGLSSFGVVDEELEVAGDVGVVPLLDFVFGVDVTVEESSFMFFVFEVEDVVLDFVFVEEGEVVRLLCNMKESTARGTMEVPCPHGARCIYIYLQHY